MRIAMIAAECEPFAKTGGLADVVDALARALGRLPGEPLDAPVDVFLPRYRGIAAPEGAPRHVVRVPDPRALSGTTEVTVVDIVADGYRLRLVDHPPAFDRDGFYGDRGGDYPDNGWRFGLFCRAALETLRAEERAVDILSVHDWHAAPAVLYRDRWYAEDAVLRGTAAMATIHNLAYHGWVPRERLRDLGLAPGDGFVDAGADGIDLLRTAIERSELVNTVSPGFAAEALTPEYGMGLDGVLRAKGDRFFGILNGLDTTVWNPATDAVLAVRYGARNRRGKRECKRQLLASLGLDPDDTGPVIGMIGRLDPQKGFDLLAAAASRLRTRGARLVVLGSGDPSLMAQLRADAQRFPDSLALVEAFDRDLARRIYAGVDLFVMPSRFEPSGQGQMIAMRYGTPPIVRRTGGLRDSVVDEITNPGMGTGFAFEDATSDALVDACEAAIGMYERGGAPWTRLVSRAMGADFDWTANAAPRYLEAFRRAVRLRSEAVGARSPR